MKSAGPVHEDESISSPVIKIPQGMIRGFVQRSRKHVRYFGFYGIPYATAERFELPRKWESWDSGIRDGTRGLDACVQWDDKNNRIIGSEKCHFLNVFSPTFKILDRDDVKDSPPIEPKEKYPVMVFIHGVEFDKGGGNLFGGKFLADEKIILITFNYRLGALGFANTQDGSIPGNLGLHDQKIALLWIKDNIRYFGGDQNNVTLVGEGSGAACVHYHLLSPLSKGLFAKGILQSGNAMCPWAFNSNPANKLKKLCKKLDLNGGSNNNWTEVVTKLKNLEAGVIMAQRRDYQSKSTKQDVEIVHFAPSVDSGLGSAAFLTDSPYTLLFSGKIENEVPLIMGINAQEGLYRSNPVLKNASKLKSLNEHWSQELPTLLMYKKDSVTSPEDYAKRVRKFYFDGRSVLIPDSFGRQRLTNMISDRLFIYPMRKTALMHRALMKDPANRIYLYYFDYTGHFSYSNGFNVSDTYGASHADELQYLMNQGIFYSKIMPGTEPDSIIDKMTSLWGRFAWTGVPSYPKQINSWTPMPLKEEIEDDVLEYFKIGREDGMIVEPFTERMQFWDHVPNLSLDF